MTFTLARNGYRYLAGKRGVYRAARYCLTAQTGDGYCSIVSEAPTWLLSAMM